MRVPPSTGSSAMRHSVLFRYSAVDGAAGFERIFGRTVDGRQLDFLWAIFGHELYMQVVVDAGMSRARLRSLPDRRDGQAELIVTGAEVPPGAPASGT
jgi:hypothetical protein